MKREITQMDEGELRTHPRNPRRGDLEAIAESIQHNGWFGVLVVQRSTGYILVGNHRYQAGRLGGAHFGIGADDDDDRTPFEPITSFPSMVIDVDDRTALRILLADNRASDVATYDVERLIATLDELRGADDLEDPLVGSLFDDEAADDLLRSLNPTPPTWREFRVFEDPDPTPTKFCECPNCHHRIDLE